MNLRKKRLTLSLLGALMLIGCGSDSTSSAQESPKEADVIVATRIDDSTGFINALKADTAHQSTNGNGIEINPLANVFPYKGAIFMAESMMGDKIVKYVKDNETYQNAGVINTGEGSMPSNIIFADDTKAYAGLSNSGKLLVFNPSDMTKIKEIDLSAYALNANGNVDGNDTNPEPTSGVIRDGKLYMAMLQVDSFQTVKCQGKASVIVIDVATDVVLNHAMDDRTCSSARPVANLGIFMDEKKDIYVNNEAGFGFYPGLNSGILRIKNGEDTFDPDYYFSITDLPGLTMGNGQTSGFLIHHYAQNGKLYTALNFPSLYSNPIDYVNDKTFQPYILDIYNQTATKLDLPATNGWTTGIISYGDKVLFGLSALEGDGLYRYDPLTGEGDQTPYISTDGIPTYVINY